MKVVCVENNENRLMGEHMVSLTIDKEYRILSERRLRIKDAKGYNEYNHYRIINDFGIESLCLKDRFVDLN